MKLGNQFILNRFLKVYDVFSILFVLNKHIKTDRKIAFKKLNITQSSGAQAKWAPPMGAHNDVLRGKNQARLRA